MLSANGEAMSSVRPQGSVQDAITIRSHKQQLSPKNDHLEEDGPKFGIIESYLIMQAAVSIIILSIVTHLWANEGQSPSAFLVLFFFQIFILVVALILLATGNDAWFSFVFAQLVFFIGTAELTTSAFVFLRDNKLERCREFGCTVVRGSTFLRTRFTYASALCGLFHIAIGIVYLIMGPHCHDTPEPKIVISKSLFARLKIKLSNADRNGSTMHTMSREPELNDVAIDECTTQTCATTTSSAEKLCSDAGTDAAIPHAVRTLERSKDIETFTSEANSSHPFRTIVVQTSVPLPLSVRYLNSSLQESVRTPETSGYKETTDTTICISSP